VILHSWGPEGGWLTLLVVAVGLAAVISGVAIALAGRRMGRVATGVMLGYVVIVGGAAAARIALAVDRGRDSLDLTAIVVGFGLAGAAVLVALPLLLRAPSASSSRRALAGGALTVASVGMLVVAVFANLEPPA
jgi:hypothetical protein